MKAFEIGILEGPSHWAIYIHIGYADTIKEAREVAANSGYLVCRIYDTSGLAEVWSKPTW